MIKAMKKSAFFSIVFTVYMFAASPLGAITGILSIPDSADIRHEIMEAWLTAPVSAVLEHGSEVHLTSFGQSFRVSAEERGEELAVIVAPREEEYEFPSDISGSWILYRDMETGKLLRIQVFFQNDPNVFLILHPDARPLKPKSSADLLIYGAYVAKNVPIGLAFEDVACLSFGQLFDLTRHTIPWHYVQYDPRKYSNVLSMVSAIRKNVTRFEYIEDAGYNELEEPVFLSTGEARSETPGKLSVNADGFTKWIVDGITASINGNGISLDVLRALSADSEIEDYTQQNGNGAINPYTWIRSLSAAALSAAMDKNIIVGAGGTDVQCNPFADDETKSGTQRVVGFVEDAGYSINMLKPLFYVLAATEPDMMYLGAVKAANSDAVTEEWCFDHSAAFFPYFDAAGTCHVAVFESGIEVPFDEFVAKNPDTYVFLCRIKATDRFLPQ